MIKRAASLFSSQVPIYPLVTFRIIFGLLMMFSIIRFWSKGWINDLYIAPDFHFHYYGFAWVKVLPPEGMYILFAIMFIAAAGICLGYFYRLASIAFFMVFTYVELIDVSNYLNHYYFVSVISFILIFLPANRQASLDLKLRNLPPINKVNWWLLNIIKLQISIVYLYAGLAKLNSDWILEALPLKMWLPAHASLPLLGSLFTFSLTAYIFSWIGALFDISIPFLLWKARTRKFAYMLVIVFHLLTALLFPIGIFPWIMMFSTLIFFSSNLHKNSLQKMKLLFKTQTSFKPLKPILRIYFLIIVLTFQAFWPWRYLLYDGNVFWTEEAYRFSWRVMLMEKAGYVNYYIHHAESGNIAEENPGDYLSEHQLKQLSTQPDLILQFAHFLHEKYRKMGYGDVEVKAEAWVSYNGRRSNLLIDPTVDLSKKTDSYRPKDWILDYE